ncbi:MAG TPA: M23 family metallopeptidase [Candidatus Eubacterium faecipullorum]|uniref:M23 family metallopeptidase n=1 Tax=Candidatus Eubacterium faecipullorum TaxID=2838571 RepID=A0A9D1UF83_9FIRM|nr:M23 family metallopeptidase [Candidatus Eubacterium faecipullorum]
MSTQSNSKKSGKNLKILFSAVCVFIIAVGVVVYFSTSSADDVNEPTTIADTTAVQNPVTVQDTTAAQTTTQATTARQTTQQEETSMPQGEDNTPYKSYYEYPLSETAVQGYTEELVKNDTMGDYRSHTAVDFKGAAGDSVIAVNDGLVLDVYNDSLLGMTVEIDHGGKLVARYCGLDSVSVSAGSRVEAGQEIGTLGSVPFEASLESHLHFETLLDGAYVDPLTVMGKTE